MNRWNQVLKIVFRMRKEHPDWREGQIYFNALWFKYPDVANIVRATEYDCFHSDKRIPAFRKAVKRILSEYTFEEDYTVIPDLEDDVS